LRESSRITGRFAQQPGLFGGTSSGVNVIAALRLAEQLGPDATAVTVRVATGMKYLKRYGANLN
jgi:cysteine synthase A